MKNSPSASTPDNKEITSDLAAALSMLSSSNTAVRNLEKEMGGAAVQSPLRDDDSGLADKVWWPKRVFRGCGFACMT